MNCWYCLFLSFVQVFSVSPLWCSPQPLRCASHKWPDLPYMVTWWQLSKLHSIMRTMRCGWKFGEKREINVLSQITVEILRLRRMPGAQFSFPDLIDGHGATETMLLLTHKKECISQVYFCPEKSSETWKQETATENTDKMTNFINKIYFRNVAILNRVIRLLQGGGELWCLRDKQICPYWFYKNALTTIKGCKKFK